MTDDETTDRKVASLARLRASAAVQEWNRQTRGALGQVTSLSDMVTDIAHEIRRAWGERMAMESDPDKTPPMPTRMWWVPPQKQKWIISHPGGKGEVAFGLYGDPPVCKPCEKTPELVPNPTFHGQRQCGGCKSNFVPDYSE